MEHIIYTQPYQQVLDVFLNCYTQEFGSRKLEEVLKKVRSSNKITMLLLKAKRDQTRLGVDDYLLTLHSSSSFWLAKGETLFVAATIMLSMWDDEVGRPYSLSGDPYLNEMFFKLLEKCESYKIHTSGKLNFFDQLRQFLLIYFTYQPKDDIIFEGFDEEPDKAGGCLINWVEEPFHFSDEWIRYSLGEAESSAQRDEQESSNTKQPIESRGLLYCSECYVALDEENNCIRCKTHYEK